MSRTIRNVAIIILLVGAMPFALAEPKALHVVKGQPLAPAFERPPVDGQLLLKSLQSVLVCSMHHGRNQHHNDARINFAAQKTHRGRGMPLAASIARTAETAASFP